MSDPDDRKIEESWRTGRRTFLSVVGAAGVAGVASGFQDDESGSGDDGGTENESAAFAKTELTSGLTDPMKLDVAPDGRVFYTVRGGDFAAEDQGDHSTAVVGVIDPETEETSVALELDVYIGDEDGLQGIAFDPDFEENGWVYIYYSPPNDEVGDQPYNQLSRFTVFGDEIDATCEVPILEVHTQRETCCHVGGDVEFGPEGHLYLSTGDDTNPFESNGYTPIDEREGREPWDAQRSAGNTADLRGKILRIVPHDDGSYSVPEDNLFTEEQGYDEEIEDGLVRPEIYVMGLRNPFTLEIDDETGALWYADYGPDAGEWNTERGPNGIVELSRVTEAHNAGWPFFVGPNIPYVDGTFEDAESEGEDEPNFTFDSSGEPFDPDNPINDSVNNDGLEELPPAQPADIWYPNDWDAYLDAPDWAEEYLPHGLDEEPWPEIPAGGAPMAGPVYRHADAGERALPDEFDGKHFAMEWGANWIKTVDYDEDGNVAAVEDFMPDAEFLAPMDMEVGPDGTLYLMEWGEGFAGTTESGIYRIEPSD